MPTPDIDISQIKTDNKKLEAYQPKMDKLIEFGLIKKGDKIYLTLKPDESVATLIDENTLISMAKKSLLMNGDAE